MNLPANRQKMAGAHIDKVTSSRHRSVGETGGSQHSQDKEKSKSPEKNGRQDLVQDCNFVAVSFGVGCVKHNWRNYGKGTSFLFTVPRQ